MTKNKLKEVAMRLFGEKGYDGTALSEIAKEVGVKTPAIYAFYASKEDLFMTAFREAMEAYNAFTHELTEEKQELSTRESLYRILVRQCEFYEKSPELNRFALRSLLFPASFLKETIEQAFLESDKMLTKAIEDRIVQGIENGSLKDRPVEMLVDSFLNLTDGLSMEYFYYSSKELYMRKLNNAFEMYWNGACSS
ncbi:TetR/AcrR family transcriptional regulator [Paenibacillus radicibacter]|uniref:TetR/AcrR family transcriptional regulator n=1 Tax=Paenibacillus radicibacter TaxID=2972488 RepID=UPI00280B75CD|nr:TetR/AcrR family transcriptional regulator [Paenibacillus radicibacter]